MKILCVKKMTVHHPHQTVEHIARSVRTRESVCRPESGDILTYSADSVSDDGRNREFLRPFGETSHSLRKRGSGRGSVALPQFRDDLLVNFSEFLLRPDTDEHMKVAKNQRDRRKKAFPCVHGSFPSVGIHGFRRIIGSDIPGFLLIYSVSFFQGVPVSAVRNGNSENAFHRYGGGDIGFLTPDPGMPLIGDDMFRQFPGFFHGRTDNAVPSEGLFRALPVHGIPAEKAGDSPERDGEFTKEQPLLRIVGHPCHIRHDKGRAGSMGDSGNFYAADHNILFFRYIAILHPPAQPGFGV